MALCPPVTLSPPRLSWNQTPGSPEDLIKTLHSEIQASGTSGAGARTLWTWEQTGRCSSSLTDPQQIISTQRHLKINSSTLLSLKEQGESRYSCSEASASFPNMLFQVFIFILCLILRPSHQEFIPPLLPTLLTQLAGLPDLPLVRCHYICNLLGNTYPCASQLSLLI